MRSAARAKPALEALEGWLWARLVNEAEAADRLGPPAPPSGDDYPGGMLVALRLTGPRVQADACALATAHLACASSATSPPSPAARRRRSSRRAARGLTGILALAKLGRSATAPAGRGSPARRVLNSY